MRRRKQWAAAALAAWVFLMALGAAALIARLAA